VSGHATDDERTRPLWLADFGLPLAAREGRVAARLEAFHDRLMNGSSASALTLVTLALLTCGLASGGREVSAQRSARRAPARDLRAELARVDLDPCFEDPAWIDSATRVSVVVHPDGVWALALDGAVTDANHASMAPALRTCLEDRLRATWGEVIAPPPRRDEVHVRTFDFRVHHEDPAVRRTELRERFERVRRDLTRCVLDLPERRLDVVVRLGADGRVEVELPRADVNRGLCIANSLGTFMPGASVTLRETIDGRVARRAVTAGEGELCAWGGHRGPPPLDEVRSCAAGLTCCAAGGAAGSDSICMRTTHCPAYP
jgi:hypothetical protein